jgi:hypothetical protein
MSYFGRKFMYVCVWTCVTIKTTIKIRDGAEVGKARITGETRVLTIAVKLRNLESCCDVYTSWRWKTVLNANDLSLLLNTLLTSNDTERHSGNQESCGEGGVKSCLILYSRISGIWDQISLRYFRFVCVSHYGNMIEIIYRTFTVFIRTGIWSAPNRSILKHFT